MTTEFDKKWNPDTNRFEFDRVEELPDYVQELDPRAGEPYWFECYEESTNVSYPYHLPSEGFRDDWPDALVEREDIRECQRGHYYADPDGLRD